MHQVRGIRSRNDCFAFSFRFMRKGKGMSNYTYKHHVDAHKAYQSHDSYEAVLDSVRLFWATHRFLLPNNCIKILELVAGYSKEVIGVSWLKFEKIISTVGISRKTFERCMNKLVEYGIIEKHQEKHKNGGRRSFLVIKPFSDSPEETVQQPKLDKAPEANLTPNDALPVALNDALPKGSEEPAKPSSTSDFGDEDSVRNERSSLAVKYHSLKPSLTHKTKVNNNVSKTSDSRTSKFVQSLNQKTKYKKYSRNA